MPPLRPHRPRPPAASGRPRGVRPRGSVLLAGALLAAGTAAAAQRPAPATQHAGATAAPPDGRDSARVLRDARRAQAAFELRRRGLLPESWIGGGRCDVRIGRFCYWYDEGAGDGPAEPPRIGAERDGLLARLAVARAAVADPWLIGQQVRYRLEHGAPDSALAALAGCAAAAGWCDALRGLVHHARGDAPAAASAFAAARGAMPSDARCAWTDIRLLLDGEARAAYEALPCAARDSVAERYWWLATPFFARGGNDRRNEHEARLALARLLADSRTPYTESWRDDLSELLVRYGWPERWSRRPAPLSQPGAVAIVGHDPSPAWHFAASAAARADPYAAAPDDWSLREPLAVERYAPPFARRLHDLPATAAVLRRGDSLLVVATYHAPEELAAAGGAGELTMALVREADAPRLLRAPLAPQGGALAALAPDRPYLLSLEILAGAAHAARARFAVRPPPVVAGFGISDLLLHEPAREAGEAAARPPLPPALDAVLATALGADRLRTPGRLGVYWELYGLPPGAGAVELTLTVGGNPPGWTARVWERLRRRPPRTPVHLRWTDVVVAEPGAPVARDITVELPALPAGRYELALRARDAAGGREVVARRTMTIERR